MPSGDPAQPSNPPRRRSTRPHRNRQAPDPQPWTRDAACAACDPDLFFPDEQRDPTIGDAKRVCAGCPVRAECLDYSLATRQQHGIWGGLDEWDRASLLNPQHQQRDGTQGAA